MNDDNELIITNDTELEQVPVQQPEAQTSQQQQDETTPADEAEQTFRQAVEEQIHEEDAPTSQGISVMHILGGDFFTSQILRKQIWIMLFISCFVIVYISNRYSCQKSMLEIDKLKKELQDAKYKALSTSSRLTEVSRQSNVLDMLKQNNDTLLRIATQPPFIVNVPAE